MLEDPELNGVGAPTSYLLLWSLMWMYLHRGDQIHHYSLQILTNPVGLSVYQSAIEFYKLRRHVQKNMKAMVA